MDKASEAPVTGAQNKNPSRQTHTRAEPREGQGEGQGEGGRGAGRAGQAEAKHRATTTPQREGMASHPLKTNLHFQDRCLELNIHYL